MGRRRQGPRQLKSGGPFCAVLHVPKDLRPQVGKERLIRSLKTHDHTEAFRRYGRATQQLEQDLEVLLGGGSLSARVEQHREGVVRPGDTALTPAELIAITLGDFNPNDKTRLAVYESFTAG